MNSRPHISLPHWIFAYSLIATLRMVSVKFFGLHSDGVSAEHRWRPASTAVLCINTGGVATDIIHPSYIVYEVVSIVSLSRAHHIMSLDFQSYACSRYTKILYRSCFFSTWFS